MNMYGRQFSARSASWPTFQRPPSPRHFANSKAPENAARNAAFLEALASQQPAQVPRRLQPCPLVIIFPAASVEPPLAGCIAVATDVFPRQHRADAVVQIDVN